MNKIWLIIQREYLTRVRKKSFLVTTILIPILVFGLMTSMIVLSLKSEQKQTIAVLDDSGLFKHKLDSTSKSFSFIYVEKKNQETNKQLIYRTNSDMLLHIFPFKGLEADSIVMYKEGGVSLLAKNFIGDELDAQYQIRLLESAGIDKVQIDSINSRSLQLRSYDLDNNKETNSEISSGIGYVMGFLIYIIIFIYGAGVMRGVMEEKTNRIAEVIVSSVKPFQLMMGKIIGIGFVGLTQFGLWAFLMLLLNIALPFLIPGMSDNIPSAMPMTPDVQTTMQTIDDNDKLKLFNAIKDQNWGVILSCFLFYFLGGYFLYAAMFAAVGSLVNEDPQEAQQLTIPITMPIIFGFIIMATSVNDPHSNLSVFGSLFPLTSPIVMMARIPYGVPIWQLILSMGLLVLGFVIMTWLSAKIYRTGILLYGKKVTWKEVLKWIRYS
jgi:ABC-2 type transport system permease protein